MLTNVTAYIKQLTEYGEFKLDFSFEGEKFKMPKIKAKIIGKTKPKNVTIFVLSEYGFCYFKGYKFDIEFNHASYSLTIQYDITSRYINITIYKDIGEYEYNITPVERKTEMITEGIIVEKII